MGKNKGGAASLQNKTNTSCYIQARSLDCLCSSCRRLRCCMHGSASARPEASLASHQRQDAQVALRLQFSSLSTLLPHFGMRCPGHRNRPDIEKESCGGRALTGVDVYSSCSGLGSEPIWVDDVRSDSIHGLDPAQVLGLGMDTGDTTPSVLLFFDNLRFLFNVGEGFQRFCVQHRVKLSKTNGIFVTRTSTDAAGGLPGVARVPLRASTSRP